MKKIITLLLITFFSINVFPQLSEGGVPLSYDQSYLKGVNVKRPKTLARINVQKLLKSDEAEGVNNRYSIYEEVDVDIKEKGSVLEAEGGKVWTYSINSENALSIGLIFSDYLLPEGASLFIYNKESDIIYGAFTAKNNKEYGTLTIADFPGNELTIEYFEPDGVLFEGNLVLGKVGQSYKEPLKKNATDFGTSDDINCPIGDHVQLEKHAVAKMTYEVDGSGYLCTGALINTTRNDGTPYFLTAMHCLSTEASAQTLVTYFNYEKRDCGGSATFPKTLSGSTIKASYEPSDMSLLLLDETPTPEYQPYFAGWNAESDSVVGSGVGIHHPAGEVKKVAIENDEIYSYGGEINWEGGSSTPEHTHWVLEYDQGFTKGGSSGSPLFDENMRIIGQLHGGDPYDLYGKLSISWNEGGTDSKKLKPYLDPDDQGVLVQDGHYPDDNKVDAHFLTDFTDVCKNTEVILTDASLFSPDTWEWRFRPETVEFLYETDKNTSSPVVRFLEEDSYDVILTVSNESYTDILSRNDYFTSGNSISPRILEDDIRLCSSAFDSLTLHGMNSAVYSWDIAEGKDYVIFEPQVNSSSFTFKKNDTTSVDSSYDVVVQLVGGHGICSDTVYGKVTLEYAFNDNIENAYPLKIGNNGLFNNRCATTQLNEPNPPEGDCNTQSTWCGCEVSDTLIDNSVWFTIVGPASGVLAIDVPGFDNQIALYEAESAEDILSGDPSLYRILASNDDYHSEAESYAAMITRVEVEPGKMYWVQVDGSACGAEGEFRIRVYDRSMNAIEDEQYNGRDYVVYPNPSNGSFFVKGDFNNASAISVYTIEGKKVWESKIKGLHTDKLDIQLPTSLNMGLYFIEVINNRSSSISKFLLE